MSTMWNGAQRDAMTFGITDDELWALVSAASARHHHAPKNGRCGYCEQLWPCGAERLASLADEAQRHPTPSHPNQA